MNSQKNLQINLQQMCIQLLGIESIYYLCGIIYEKNFANTISQINSQKIIQQINLQIIICNFFCRILLRIYLRKFICEFHSINNSAKNYQQKKVQIFFADFVTKVVSQKTYLRILL